LPAKGGEGEAHKLLREGLPHQTFNRRHAVAAREHIGRQQAVFHAQVIPQQALERGAQVAAAASAQTKHRAGAFTASKPAAVTSTQKRTNDVQ
jgi:hypothetical protein